MEHHFAILFISNNEKKLSLLTALCTRLSFVLTQVEDWMAGLDFLIDNQVDAIILDTTPSREDAYAFLNAIQQDIENIHTPIILICDHESYYEFAKSAQESNIIAIFLDNSCEHQINNLLNFISSQSLSTKVLRSELEESEHRTVIDPLTGALNRYGGEDKFTSLSANYKAYNEPFSLVMLDIDHFKSINDTYGHDIGDEVLVSLAELIRNSIRKSDALIRLGGEEFIVFLANTEINIARNIAENIRKTIEVTGHSSLFLDVTASFGVVSYIENEELVEILKRADELLYEAKHSGRNRVVCVKSLQSA